MESSIEMLAAVAFLVTGISHIAQPRAWCDFFTRLRDLGNTGVFAAALVGFPTGLVIVSFHNVWTGPPALLTVIGWGFCAKSFVYLTYPQAGMKALSRISTDSTGKFVAAGIALVAMSVFCGYVWLTQPS